jgi:hypothetical protein
MAIKGKHKKQLALTLDCVQFVVNVENFHDEVMDNFEHPCVDPQDKGSGYFILSYQSLEDANEWYEKDLDDVMTALVDMDTALRVRDRMVKAVKKTGRGIPKS